MLRKTVKTAAYFSGALSAYHSLRNRRTLTVLMFHRVLPAAECQAVRADPLWTISAELFEKALDFLGRHYNPVGLEQVLAARMHRTALPPRALLITFDDGWRDNLDYALPLLLHYRMPAAIFAASDAVEEQRRFWWQELVLWSLRIGMRTVAELSREAGFAADRQMSVLQLLGRYAELEPGRRDELLRPLALAAEPQQQRPQMVDPGALRALADAGLGVAVHGAAHLPLTDLKDPAADLAQARGRIALHTGRPQSLALSFPHGRYDARVVDAARGLGFKLLFTSDAIVNSCPDGWLDSDLIGRIPVFSQEIAESDGRLSESALAAWQFMRPRRTIN